MIVPITASIHVNNLLPVIPQRIVGLDLSLTSTGWSAFYSPDEVRTGTLKSKFTGVARLVDLREQLRVVLNEHNPEAIGLEGYSFGSIGRHHSTGEWGGIAKIEVLARCPGFILPPTTVKKFITGNSNAEKGSMALHLFKRFGLTVEQPDECDAACIGITLAAHLFPASFPDLLAFQLEAFVPKKGKEPPVQPLV